MGRKHLSISVKHLAVLAATTVLLMIAAPAEGAQAEDRWCDLIFSSATNYPNALAALEQAKKFGPQDPRYSRSLKAVTSNLFRLGRFDEAEPYLNEDLKILEEMGPNYPGLNHTLLLLGMLKEKRGDLTGAEELINRALRLSLRFPTGQAPTPPVIYANLSALAFATGRIEEGKRHAEASARYIFRSKKRVQETRDYGLYKDFELVVWHLEECRAKLLRTEASNSKNGRIGRMYDACQTAHREFSERVLLECAKSHGSDSTLYLDCLYDIARRYPVERPDLAREGFNIVRRYDPPDFARKSRFERLVARYHSATHDFDQSEFLYRQALRSSRSSRTPAVLVETVENTEAYCYMKRDKLFAAIDTIRNAITVDFLNDGSRESLCRRLALRYEQAGTRCSAERKFKQGADFLKQACDLRAPYKVDQDFRRSLWLLAHTYALYDPDKALPILEKLASPSSVKDFLREDVTRRAQVDLARIYERLGRDAEAAAVRSRISDRHFEIAVKECKLEISSAQPWSDNHRDLLIKLGNTEKQQAQTLALEGKIDESIALSGTALNHYQQAQRIGRPLVAPIKCKLELGNLQLDQKRYEDAEKTFKNIIADTQFLFEFETVYLRRQAIDQLRKVYLATGQIRQGQNLNETNCFAESQAISDVLQSLWKYDFPGALRQLEQLKQIDTRMFGEDSDPVLMDCLKQVETLARIHDYDAIEKVCKGFLKSRSPALQIKDGEHLLWCGLACVHNRFRRYKEAEAISRRLIEIPRTKIDMLSRGISYYQLALSLRRQDNERGASETLTEARKQYAGQAVLAHQGRWQGLFLYQLDKKELEKVCFEEIAFFDKFDGRDTTGLALLRIQLAALMQENGKHATAQLLYDQAMRTLAWQERACPEMIHCLDGYERVLRSEKKIELADSLRAKRDLLKKGSN